MSILKTLLADLAEKRRRQALKHTYRAVFTSEAGKVVLRDLLKTYCVTPSFNVDERVARITEGKRLLVLQLAHTVFEPDLIAEEILRLTAQIEEEKKYNQGTTPNE